MSGQKQDCYFYIDETLSESERKVCTLCMECSKKFPGLGWFWEGSRLGYGPFDFLCEKCGNYVHQAPKPQELGQERNENDKTSI